MRPGNATGKLWAPPPTGIRRIDAPETSDRVIPRGRRGNMTGMADPVATALEQHAHSLRDLARALVGPGDADDVVDPAEPDAEVAVRDPAPQRDRLTLPGPELRLQPPQQRVHGGTV